MGGGEDDEEENPKPSLLWWLQTPFVLLLLCLTVQEQVVSTAVCYPCLVSRFPNCQQSNLNQCPLLHQRPQILAQSYYSGQRLKIVTLSKVHFPLICNFSSAPLFKMYAFTYLKCLSFNISVLSAFTINNLKTIPCQWMYRVLREYQNYIIWKTM